MYNFNTKAVQTEPLTIETILSKVSEYDIYAHYLGKFNIGHIYNSPFRKDKNPSFGIFYSKKTGKLLFKDHGSGLCGDVVKFVREYTGITNYNELLHRIVNDLKITNNTVLKAKKEFDKPSETVIGVVRQDFTQVDKQYWKQFGITTKTLKQYDVHSIKYYLCNGIVKGVYKDDNPMYAYKVYNRFKIYRPLANKYSKWRNNLRDVDIQGFEQLPETGDLLIITKSMKDVMVYKELGYNAVSPSSESTFIPDKVLKALKKRFKTILINFDRDVPGIKQMRSVGLKTGLRGFLVHKQFKAKDISDAVKINGINNVKSWLNRTIKTK